MPGVGSHCPTPHADRTRPGIAVSRGPGVTFVARGSRCVLRRRGPRCSRRYRSPRAVRSRARRTGRSLRARSRREDSSALRAARLGPPLRDFNALRLRPARRAARPRTHAAASRQNAPTAPPSARGSTRRRAPRGRERTGLASERGCCSAAARSAAVVTTRVAQCRQRARHRISPHETKRPRRAARAFVRLTATRSAASMPQGAKQIQSAREKTGPAYSPGPCGDVGISCCRRTSRSARSRASSSRCRFSRRRPSRRRRACSGRGRGRCCSAARRASSRRS